VRPFSLELLGLNCAGGEVMTRRIRYSLVHLGVSASVVAPVVAVALLVWYPAPLASLEGVGLILLIIAAVDVCLGPLLTSIVASPNKSTRELARDLSVIGFVQLAALMYGVHSTFFARPAFVVYNTDRFDIVTPSELVWDSGAGSGDPEMGRIPLTGPKWVQALPPESAEVRNRFLFQAIGGGPDLKQYPQLYRKWPSEPDVIRSRMKGLDTLAENLEAHERAHLTEVLNKAGLVQGEVSYVPLLGRQRMGIALLRRSDLSLVAAMDITPPY